MCVVFKTEEDWHFSWMIIKLLCVLLLLFCRAECGGADAVPGGLQQGASWAHRRSVPFFNEVSIINDVNLSFVVLYFFTFIELLNLLSCPCSDTPQGWSSYKVSLKVQCFCCWVTLVSWGLAVSPGGGPDQKEQDDPKESDGACWRLDVGSVQGSVIWAVLWRWHCKQPVHIKLRLHTYISDNNFYGTFHNFKQTTG